MKHKNLFLILAALLLTVGNAHAKLRKLPIPIIVGTADYWDNYKPKTITFDGKTYEGFELYDAKDLTRTGMLYWIPSKQWLVMDNYSYKHTDAMNPFIRHPKQGGFPTIVVAVKGNCRIDCAGLFISSKKAISVIGEKNSSLTVNCQTNMTAFYCSSGVIVSDVTLNIPKSKIAFHTVGNTGILMFMNANVTANSRDNVAEGFMTASAIGCGISSSVKAWELPYYNTEKRYMYGAENTPCKQLLIDNKEGFQLLHAGKVRKTVERPNPALTEETLGRINAYEFTISSVKQLNYSEKKNISSNVIRYKLQLTEMKKGNVYAFSRNGKFFALFFDNADMSHVPIDVVGDDMYLLFYGTCTLGKISSNAGGTVTLENATLGGSTNGFTTISDKYKNAGYRTITKNGRTIKVANTVSYNGVTLTLDDSSTPVIDIPRTNKLKINYLSIKVPNPINGPAIRGCYSLEFNNSIMSGKYQTPFKVNYGVTFTDCGLPINKVKTANFYFSKQSLSFEGVGASNLEIVKSTNFVPFAYPSNSYQVKIK